VPELRNTNITRSQLLLHVLQQTRQSDTTYTDVNEHEPRLVLDKVLRQFLNTLHITLQQSYLQWLKYNSAKPLHTVYRTRDREQLGRK